MTVEKITISVPATIAAQVRKAVSDGSAESVSAYFTAAAAQTTRHGALQALLDEMNAEYGPPTPADFAWADEALNSRRA